MSGQSYLIGWLLYLLGSVCFLGLVWYLTRSLAARYSWPLRALLAALVLLPWQAGPEHRELAPAWVVALFEGLVQEDISLWRAGAPLLIVAALSACLGFAEYWRLTRNPGGPTHE